MSRDVPVFVPTSAGPLGGIVSEPDDEPVGAAVILEGINGRRSGVNQIWTHAGRSIADLGLVVLRVDHPGRGDSNPVAERVDVGSTLMEGIRWFRVRTAGLPVHLIGSCYGVRPAVAWAREEPAIAGMTLLLPYLARPRRRGLAARAGRRFLRELSLLPRPAVDERLCTSIVDVARRAPTAVIAGERDPHRDHALDLRERARARGVRIDLELVPGVALHGHRSPTEQRATVVRLTDRVSSALGERSAGWAGAAAGSDGSAARMHGT